MNRLEGKNLDEVLANYAKDNECDIADISYNIVEEKKSLLGFGNKIVVDLFSSKDVEAFLKDYLNKFFEGLDMKVDVDVNKDQDLYRISLNADNNAILIGKAGTTLQALNTVVKAAVSSKFKRRVQVLVDINGYKEERYSRLEAIAKGIAQSVVSTKQSALLDPMPADERKIIHQCLNGIEHIKTISEGEGKDRAIRIVYED